MRTYCGLDDSGTHEHAADCYQSRAPATAAEWVHTFRDPETHEPVLLSDDEAEAVNRWLSIEGYRVFVDRTWIQPGPPIEAEATASAGGRSTEGAAARPDAAALAEAIEIVRQRLMESDAGHESGWVWPVLDDLARLPAAPAEQRLDPDRLGRFIPDVLRGVGHRDEHGNLIRDYHTCGCVQPAAAEGDDHD